MKLPVYRDPPGQTMTTVDTKIFQNESILTVGDLLDYSPGVTIAQGNSARDVVISIRGSGARTSTGLANIVVLEDGFSLTTANGGVGSTLNMDPHAYGAVDVYRGGSSALWGNYAMEGAVNFRMRSGAQIDGAEIGSEYGSFGTAQNWAIGGRRSATSIYRCSRPTCGATATFIIRIITPRPSIFSEPGRRPRPTGWF